MKPILILLLLTFATLAGAIELTDTEGRTIHARILKYGGDRVDIQMRTGRRYTVKLDTLSEASQLAVKEWHRKELEKLNDPFDIRKNTHKTEETSRSTASTKIEGYNLAYEFTLKNKTLRVFDKVKVEYILFHKQAQPAAQSRDAGFRKRIRGEAEIENLGKFKEASFMTKKVHMRESDLRANWDYANGGKEKAEDEIEAIWIRFYVDGVMVQEYAVPKSITDEPWELKE